MYADSNLATVFRVDNRLVNYRIFGDLAYGNDDVITRPFAGAEGSLASEQRAVNRSMGEVRICIEWSYQLLVFFILDDPAASRHAARLEALPCFCCHDKWLHLS
ncbi:TPA: hypothetical protein N0F65_005584 [Lagenidium giganteum]|uniref:DDE Tnp4 domain-containing protein n=1 Tax=Lagenidium giganteum TaxID=4803 RepID=A0AAV2Z6T3_9STRA|nr:TPA: hypothetical protein N0F65_005584 [Lagenidium giganteum]